MSNKSQMGYVYIFFSIIFTVYSQVMIKWSLSRMGAGPEVFPDKFIFLFKAIFNPFVFSGFVAAFMGGLCWMAALTKFDISYAYPFMSLAFVLVTICSYFLLNESLSAYKLTGLLLIIAGIIVAAKG